MTDDDGIFDPDDPGAPQAAENRGLTRDGGSVTHLRGNGGSAPLADRAEKPPEDDEDEAQKPLFEVELVGGRLIKTGNLVKAGTPTEIRYVLTGKSIPNVRGGIVDPYETSALLVLDCVVDTIKPQYIRDGNQNVEKVIWYVTLKPRVVQQALSKAGQEMLEQARLAQAAA